MSVGDPRIDAFHAHLDKCEKCRNNPMDLCPEGHALIIAVVGEEAKAKEI